MVSKTGETLRSIQLYTGKPKPLEDKVHTTLQFYFEQPRQKRETAILKTEAFAARCVHPEGEL